MAIINASHIANTSGRERQKRVTEKGKSGSDPACVRNDRPKNLLRWDLTLKPGAAGENAAVLSCHFKRQYDRDVSIGNVTATK